MLRISTIGTKGLWVELVYEPWHALDDAKYGKPFCKSYAISGGNQ